MGKVTFFIVNKILKTASSRKHAYLYKIFLLSCEPMSASQLVTQLRSIITILTIFNQDSQSRSSESKEFTKSSEETQKAILK